MTPHDVPTAAQLLAAVGDWIERDLIPATEGKLRYDARVARTILGIAEREFELGPAQHAAHLARLAQLGVADEAELAAGIRNGRFDERLPEVREVVRQTVLDKLAVANPGYVRARSSPPDASPNPAR